MSKPTEEDKRDGFKQKYLLSHADGSPVDPDAEYFVLRLDFHDDCDKTHILACREAVRVYSFLIRDHLPALSADLQGKM